MKEYFNENNLLGPHGENDIVFTAQYCVLSKKRQLESIETLSAFFRRAIRSLTVGNGFSALPEEPWSHDNHTALLCGSKAVRLEYHKKFFYDGWYRRVHPRDLIFYIYLTNSIFTPIAWLFLWIPSIAMILTCCQNYKVRVENNQKVRYLKTDGKLLTWLRLHAVNMPITKFFCNLAIKRNEKFKSWKNVFRIYFKDPNHPLNRFEKNLYTP